MEHGTLPTLGRETFREHLNRALLIERPTVYDVRRICPHLTHKEVDELFESSWRPGGDVFFAVPGTLVKDVCLMYNLRVDLGGVHCMKFCLGLRARTNGQLPHADKAVSYAQEAWGEALWDRKSFETLTVRLQDPKQLTDWGQPVVSLVLTCALSRPYDDITNVRSAPESEVIDNDILLVTHHRTEAAELQPYEIGGLHGMRRPNCSRCGSGHRASGCEGCGVWLDSDATDGWATPLPRNLVYYAIAQGHTFETSPAHAAALERSRWQASRRK